MVLGFAFARLKLVDAVTARGLTQFVFMLAIPALLFRTVALMKPQEATPIGLWIAFFGGLAITWILTTLISQKFDSLSASGGAAAAMAAGFGNVALLGTPLALAHYGEDAAVPLASFSPFMRPSSGLRQPSSANSPATAQRFHITGLAANSSGASPATPSCWPLQPLRFGGSRVLVFIPWLTACCPCFLTPASPPPSSPLACPSPPIRSGANGAAWWFSLP